MVRQNFKRRRYRRLAWGRSRGVTNRIIDIVRELHPNVKVTSRKRVELFGNPGSDHHVSQLRADAVDFDLVEAHVTADKISQRLGGPWNVVDYQRFNIRHNGRTFRIQLIAGVHGTGPHLHVGVRRV
jgi:hypothetical protein